MTGAFAIIRPMGLTLLCCVIVWHWHGAHGLPPLEVGYVARPWCSASASGAHSPLSLSLSLTIGFFPPLVIQTVTQPYNVFQSSLAKVTLLGERSWGELRRPWRDAAAFGAQWNSWNDTVQSALTGETPVRPNKKAAKREKAAAKRKSK